MKRTMGILLVLAMLMTLCCGAAPMAAAEEQELCEVTYATWTGKSWWWFSHRAVVVTGSLSQSSTYFFDWDTWYAVTGDVTIDGRITCRGGQIHLILCDGARLHVTKGIFVHEGTVFEIHPGILQPFDGPILSNGELIIDNPDHDNPGIGAHSLTKTGSIYIHGGRITVKGGENSAAIGGGSNADGGRVTIYSGTVTATGGAYGAGIGGGRDATGFNVDIRGGVVKAMGGYNGAGIGGGFDTSGGSITISGGQITATGNGENVGIGSDKPKVSLTIKGEDDDRYSTNLSIWASDYRYSSRSVSGSFTNETGLIFNSFSQTWWGGHRVFPASGMYRNASYVDANGADMGSVVCMGLQTRPDMWGAGVYPLGNGMYGLGDGWYHVGASPVYDMRLYIVGDVNLILRDGSTVTATEGITLTEGSSLTLWGQSGGTGKLYAGTDGTGLTCQEDSAGIGGNSGQSCGTVTINGGVVRACGSGGGAGIGGGLNGGGGRIVINGGTITAAGGTIAPAIGGSGGDIIFADGMMATAGDVTAQYNGRVSACAENEVTVTRCGHEGMYVPTEEDEWGCMYCGHASGEAGIGRGTYDAPWRVGSAPVWDTLVSAVENGFITQNKHFVLADSISVTTMMGTQANPFAGTFNGDGKTLTFNAANTDSSISVAPFAWTSGALIQGLHVAGAITGSRGRASGLIGENLDTTQVTDCQVSLSVSGSYYIAGFCVGEGPGGVHFTGCVYDGAIRSTDKGGGFVGWSEQNSGLCFTDCLFAPSSASFTAKSGTFCYDEYNSGTQSLTNCYYLTSAGTEQGIRGIAVTTSGGAAIGFGTTDWSYSVSGITASQMAGLIYDGVLYAGPGEHVMLRLLYEVPEGWFARYTASEGTLDKTEEDGVWMLTMPDDEVIIFMEVFPAFGTPDFVSPAFLSVIGDEAFEGSAVSAVLISGSCTYIGAHAFRNCDNLSQVRIPAGCEIGTDAFDGCQSVYIYGEAGSPAEMYCNTHDNCMFVEETTD